MRTTLNLPDDLMRAVKVRAAQNNSKLQDMIAALLRKGLELESHVPRGSRVKLPLIQCVHSPQPGQELTPERVAALLLEQEAHESLR